MIADPSHRFRAAALGALSFALGGVAAVGNKLLDSPHWAAGAVGSGVVLAVVLVVDAVRIGRQVGKLGRDLRADLEGLHARLDGIETKLAGRVPPIAGAGTADKSGGHRTL